MQDLVNQTAAHFAVRPQKDARGSSPPRNYSENATCRKSSPGSAGITAGVEISLETLTLDNLLEYVEIGIVDVGFAMEPHPTPESGIPAAGANSTWSAPCHADSPLSRQLSFVTPTDLRDVALINAPHQQQDQQSRAGGIPAQRRRLRARDPRAPS